MVFSISEEYGDLFSNQVGCTDDDGVVKKMSLAHCVSQDLKMGAGIALRFKNLFGRVQELKNQDKGVGQCAVLDDDDRKIFYLITKRLYFEKPTYQTMEKALLDMKNTIILNKIKTLRMPLIGCGLDKLEWKKVKRIIIDVFQDLDLDIFIYKI